MMTGMNSQSIKLATTQHSGLIPVYALFITVAVSLYHWVAESEFSAMLTLSVLVQCLATCLLAVHVLTTGSVQGISAKALQMQVIAVACRLSTTTWIEGYLPNDKTGDFLYQTLDVFYLVMLLWLLRQVFNVHCDTYESEYDSVPLAPLTVASFVISVLFHCDLDDSPIFDALWMCSLFAGALAMLPQLWLMARTPSSHPAILGHFVTVMAFSCIVSGVYFWHAHDEITSEKKPWLKNVTHGADAILGAHALQIVLLGACGFSYVKSLVSHSKHSLVELRASSPLLIV